MQSDTSSLDQRSQLIKSDAASDHSRLSITTITPVSLLDLTTEQPQQHFLHQHHHQQQQQQQEKQQQPQQHHRFPEPQIQAIDIIVDDIHERSHSLRSHTSHNTSSNDTHDTYSPFESALARSGSWASTTPTSPETEIGQVLSNGNEVSAPSHEAALMATPVLASHTPLHAGDVTKRDAKVDPAQATTLNMQHAEERRLSGLASVGHLASTLGEEEMESNQVEVSSVPDSRPSQSSSSSSLYPVSNRNKPLPIPMELCMATHPQEQNWSNSDMTSSSPIPTLSVSPAATQVPISDPVDVPSTSSTSSLNNEGSVENSHRSSLRSMLNRSSKIFRSSTTSKQRDTLQSTAESKRSPGLSSDHLSHSLISESSLPWHQKSNSPSPNASQMHLSISPHSDRSGSQFEYSPVQSAGLSKVSPPIAAPRSQSPFTFRRGTSWLGGSKLDYLQERHLKAPPSSHTPNSQSSSSASSSTSNDDLTAKQPKRQQSTSSMMPSFRQSRFSHRQSLADEGKEAKDGVAQTTIPPSNVTFANNSLQAPIAARPRLNRNRSKSMDVFDRFRSDPRLVHLQGLVGVEDKDSVAVGTTSIIEVETSPALVAEVGKAKQDRHRVADKSRFSRLLTRKSSAVAMREANNLSLTPVSDEAVETSSSSLLPAGSREGALSRLADSLRTRTSTAVLGKSKEEEAIARLEQPSQPDRVTQHRPHQSSDSSSSAFASAHSTLTKADKMMTVSDTVSPDPEGEAWWGKEEQSKERQRHMSEASISNLRAAQLAVELSGLDDPMAKGVIPFVYSPELVSKPLPIPEQSVSSNITSEVPPYPLNSSESSVNQTARKSDVSASTRLSRSVNHTRSRTMSFTRLMELFRGKSRPPSREGQEDDVRAAAVATGRHTRNESSDVGEDFASALSHTPSASDQGLAAMTPSPEDSLRQVTASSASRPAPPSSYKGLSSDNISRMTKSESDPVLVYTKKSRSASMNAPINTFSRPTRRLSQSVATYINSQPSSPVKAKSSSSTANSKGRPLFARLDSAVSDSEDDPLPPTRFSSRVVSSRPSPAASSPRKRALSRPSLTIDTEAASQSLRKPTPARPSSALGMTAELERGVQKVAAGGVGGRAQHRPSQPTLSIADDLEFLQALEEVRRVHQDRIKKQEEEASKIQQMARMGMASGNKRVKAGDYASGRPNTQKLSLNGQSPHSIQMIRRSSSADGRLSNVDGLILPLVSPTVTSSPSSSLTPKKGTPEKPSALELGVGKASGKLRDGAFINDDDWKREVKALFVIRELVLTERSYARHLEALLQAVRALYPPVPRRQMSTGSSLSRSSGAAPSIPTHIIMMRNLLPQLIALSRTLANRIDENPTAAGVGAAFRLISNQMEATFVAWSSVVQEIMDALRISEKSKSKGKDRIGLITLGSLEHTLTDKQNGVNGFVSVPSSPTSTLAPKRIMGATDYSLPNRELVESPTSLTHDGSGSNSRVMAPMASKRRSTLSGIPPSFAASLRAKATPSPPTEAIRKKLEEPSTPSLSQSLGRRAIGAVVPSSRPPLPSKSKGRTGGFGWDTDFLSASVRSLSSKSSSTLPSITTAPTTPTKTSSNALDSVTSKKLGAMDVAIMPTQRIPRYLLLLRDPNSSTPPQSLSHVRLQRSLDFVKKVANNCDRASKGGIPIPSKAR